MFSRKQEVVVMKLTLIGFSVKLEKSGYCTKIKKLSTQPRTVSTRVAKMASTHERLVTRDLMAMIKR